MSLQMECKKHAKQKINRHYPSATLTVNDPRALCGIADLLKDCCLARVCSSDDQNAEATGFLADPFCRFRSFRVSAGACHDRFERRLRSKGYRGGKACGWGDDGET